MSENFMTLKKFESELFWIIFYFYSLDFPVHFSSKIGLDKPALASKKGEQLVLVAFI